MARPTTENIAMARPREFDESAVLDAAVQCFWRHGFEATSIRDLGERTGLTGASIYNAFGDKRSFYRRALAHYVDESVGARLRRCEELPPLEGIEAFFAEIIRRSLADEERKGCLLVNSALEVAPHDPELRAAVNEALSRIEGFFLRCIEAGQANGTIAPASEPERLARQLLSTLLGIRVLARVRPERDLLEDAVAPALASLRRAGTVTAHQRSRRRPRR